MTPPRPRDRLLEAFVTAGYLGHAPRAPGTVGTLGGAAIFLVLWAAGLDAWWWPVGLALLVAVALTASSGWIRAHYGCEDPPRVVMDEVAGYLLAVPLYVEPSGWALNPWLNPWMEPWGRMAAAFVLFRIFDIAKPFPIRAAERVPRAGLVLDDLIAGACAGGVVNLIGLAAA